MKRERVEDLGRILEKLLRLHEEIEGTWGRHVQSKHTQEEFLENYTKPDDLLDLHEELRHLKYQLDEIQNLAWGEFDV